MKQYRITRILEGSKVWFQGILPSPQKGLHIAWTTAADESCSFGKRDAARDTAHIIGGIEEEASE